MHSQKETQHVRVQKSTVRAAQGQTNSFSADSLDVCPRSPPAGLLERTTRDTKSLQRPRLANWSIEQSSVAVAFFFAILASHGRTRADAKESHQGDLCWGKDQNGLRSHLCACSRCQFSSIVLVQSTSPFLTCKAPAKTPSLRCGVP